MKKEWTLGRHEPVLVELEIAKAMQDKKLPAVVRTLQKLDKRKVALMAGGTAVTLAVLSAAGKYTVYRTAVAGELKRQLTPLRRQLDQLQAENRQLHAELAELRQEEEDKA